ARRWRSASRSERPMEDVRMKIPRSYAALLLGVVAVLPAPARAQEGDKRQGGESALSSSTGALFCDSREQFSCTGQGCTKDDQPIYLAVEIDVRKEEIEVCFPSICANGRATLQREPDVTRAVAVIKPRAEYPNPGLQATPVWFAADTKAASFILVWG